MGIHLSSLFCFSWEDAFDFVPDLQNHVLLEDMQKSEPCKCSKKKKITSRIQ